MIKHTLWTTVAAFLSFVPVFALNAVAHGGAAGQLNAPIEGSLMDVINNVISALRDTIAPPIVALAVLYGGFQMIFAAGDPEKFKNGRQTLLYAAIGYIIILVASGISNLITNILSG